MDDEDEASFTLKRSTYARNDGHPSFEARKLLGAPQCQLKYVSYKCVGKIGIRLEEIAGLEVCCGC